MHQIIRPSVTWASTEAGATPRECCCTLTGIRAPPNGTLGRIFKAALLLLKRLGNHWRFEIYAINLYLHIQVLEKWQVLPRVKRGNFRLGTGASANSPSGQLSSCCLVSRLPQATALSCYGSIVNMPLLLRTWEVYLSIPPLRRASGLGRPSAETMKA